MRVILDLVETGELDIEIAEWLVGRLPVGNPHHLLLFQYLCFFDLALEKQAANLRKCCERFGIDTVTFLAVPDGVFIERDSFFGDSTEDHSPQAAVANGERIAPTRGRVPVPEHWVGGPQRRRG